MYHLSKISEYPSKVLGLLSLDMHLHKLLWLRYKEKNICLSGNEVKMLCSGVAPNYGKEVTVPKIFLCRMLH